jgi:hypothetical protein
MQDRLISASDHANPFSSEAACGVDRLNSLIETREGLSAAGKHKIHSHASANRRSSN